MSTDYFIPYAGAERPCRRDAVVTAFADQLVLLKQRKSEVRELLDGDLSFGRVCDALGVSRRALTKFMADNQMTRPWRWAEPWEEESPGVRRRPRPPKKGFRPNVGDLSTLTLKANSYSQLANIRAAVCKRFGITEAQITGAGRPRHIAYPRMIAMALSRELTSMSLPQIAQRYGNRDHTTCLHAIRTVAQRIKTDPEWAEHYNALKLHLTLPSPANDGSSE